MEDYYRVFEKSDNIIPTIRKWWVFIVYRKPRVRRVVQFSLSDEEGKKTPFAI